MRSAETPVPSVPAAMQVGPTIAGMGRVDLAIGSVRVDLAGHVPIGIIMSLNTAVDPADLKTVSLREDPVDPKIALPRVDLVGRVLTGSIMSPNSAAVPVAPAIALLRMDPGVSGLIGSIMSSSIAVDPVETAIALLRVALADPVVLVTINAPLAAVSAGRLPVATCAGLRLRADLTAALRVLASARRTARVGLGLRMTRVRRGGNRAVIGAALPDRANSARIRGGLGAIRAGSSAIGGMPSSNQSKG